VSGAGWVAGEDGVHQLLNTGELPSSRVARDTPRGASRV
jgi:hypothetical protein